MPGAVVAEPHSLQPERSKCTSARSLEWKLPAVLPRTGCRSATVDSGQPGRLPPDPVPAQRQDDRANEAVKSHHRQPGPRITGVEVGALLSYLSSKVPGRLTRSSPEPRPTRPGVGCYWLHRTSSPSNVSSTSILPTSGSGSALHEETHRVQFGAVPWLRGYLNAQIAQIVDWPS